jgi:hypothetical protein
VRNRFNIPGSTSYIDRSEKNPHRVDACPSEGTEHRDGVDDERCVYDTANSRASDTNSNDLRNRDNNEGALAPDGTVGTEVVVDVIAQTKEDGAPLGLSVLSYSGVEDARRTYDGADDEVDSSRDTHGAGNDDDAFDVLWNQHITEVHDPPAGTGDDITDTHGTGHDVLGPSQDDIMCADFWGNLCDGRTNEPTGKEKYFDITIDDEDAWDLWHKEDNEDSDPHGDEGTPTPQGHLCGDDVAHDVSSTTHDIYCNLQVINGNEGSLAPDGAVGTGSVNDELQNDVDAIVSDDEGSAQYIEEDHVDPDLLDLISLYRDGIKVILPPDLGIVYNDTVPNDVAHEAAPEHLDNRAVLSREDAIDLIDLSDLGGTIDWPRGWTYRLVKEFVDLTARRW